jgi:hypothetical protein
MKLDKATLKWVLGQCEPGVNFWDLRGRIFEAIEEIEESENHPLKIYVEESPEPVHEFNKN